MAPVTNGRILFNAVPEDYPVPGKTTVYETSETIDIENVPLRGGSKCSFFPSTRTCAAACPAFTLGQPLAGGGIGVVLRSEIAGVEVGSHVRGMLVQDLSMLEVIERDPKLNWSVYIGVAGMPGETAYMGWREYSDAKKGEVAYVSTGAGPVGSMVIQIVKQDGLKVIASAGSEEKVKFMKAIGADVAFNYKTTDVREVLAKEGPIDMNAGRSQNPGLIFAKCLHIHGFLVRHLRPKHTAGFRAELVPKIASGEIKYTEDVTRGLDKVGDVLLAVQKGTNTGKAVIVVADE
ncbi:hypothetical protein DFH06DRAFT_1143404 [Mycena polygramma]|nr:hypothetical protein DFH06DRAFT_1143404 [Mycena polygramma]